MKNRYAAMKARSLVHRCGTRDPFAIAEALGIKVVFRNDFRRQKGAFKLMMRTAFIFINANLRRRGMNFSQAQNTGGGNVREGAIIHVRFNLGKEVHRKAYEALRRANRNIYPSYADVIAEALVKFLIPEENKCSSDENDMAIAINSCADKIAEAVIQRLQISIPVSMEKGMQEEAQTKDEHDDGDLNFDYIPDEEIPWDFLHS